QPVVGHQRGLPPGLVVAELLHYRPGEREDDVALLEAVEAADLPLGPAHLRGLSGRLAHRPGRRTGTPGGRWRGPPRPPAGPRAGSAGSSWARTDASRP